VLVDDQYEELAPAMVQQVAKLTGRAIGLIVNTHYHGDHTGGNAAIARQLPSVLLLAHNQVSPRMLEDARRERPEASAEQIGAPVITFSEELRFYFEDDPLQAFFIYGGHTDGDVAVYRAGDKILHLGDLLFNGYYPYIDLAGGGSTARWIATLDAVVARVAPAVKIIPGHGPVTDLAGVRRFRSYLADTRALVEGAIRSGMSREEIIRTLKNERYPEMRDAGSFTSWEKNLGWIYDELTSQSDSSGT
jgi:glyoxylase-like metal-dependent hydrolase (beta-lactamase superfamily II)